MPEVDINRFPVGPIGPERKPIGPVGPERRPVEPVGPERKPVGPVGPEIPPGKGAGYLPTVDKSNSPVIGPIGPEKPSSGDIITPVGPEKPKHHHDSEVIVNPEPLEDDEDFETEATSDFKDTASIEVEKKPESSDDKPQYTVWWKAEDETVVEKNNTNSSALPEVEKSNNETSTGSGKKYDKWWKEGEDYAFFTDFHSRAEP